MPNTPEIGFVILWSDDPPAQVIARMGADRPDVQSGYGGWEEVERPRRSTVTTWKGQPARRLSLDLLLDGFWADASVEEDIGRIEAMALPRHGKTPPTVRIKARGGAVPYQRLAWVIDGVAWGDAAMNSAGNRTRQAVTLTLLQYIADDLIDYKRNTSPAQRARQIRQAEARKKAAREKRKAIARSRRAVRKAQARARARTGRSTARATASSASAPAVEYDGEDLMAIAARELGDARRWREIADLNGIRDPRAVVVGQVLRLP